jgi:hypothetical protein
LGFGLTRAAGRRKVRHGATAANGVRGRGLSRVEPGQLPVGHLPLRQGQGGLPQVPGRGLREDRLAGARVVPDVEPLPPRRLHPRREPRGRHAVVAGHVFNPVQPDAPRARPPLPRPLQEPGGGSRRRSGSALPLHPPQSGPRAPAPRHGTAGLPMDQPALADGTEKPTDLVSPPARPRARRETRGHPRRPEQIPRLPRLAGRGRTGPQATAFRRDVQRLGDWRDGDAGRSEQRRDPPGRTHRVPGDHRWSHHLANLPAHRGVAGRTSRRRSCC